MPLPIYSKSFIFFRGRTAFDSATAKWHCCSRRRCADGKASPSQSKVLGRFLLLLQLPFTFQRFSWQIFSNILFISLYLSRASRVDSLQLLV